MKKLPLLHSERSIKKDDNLKIKDDNSENIMITVKKEAPYKHREYAGYKGLFYVKKQADNDYLQTFPRSVTMSSQKERVRLRFLFNEKSSFVKIK